VRYFRAIAVSLALSTALLPVYAAPAKASKPLVAVSILPQAYFVQRLAGDRVEVLTIVGPGQSPHSYEPTPRQMANLSRAAIWFVNGVDFERGLEPKIRSLYPKLSIVNTTAKVSFRQLEGQHHEGEEQHEESERQYKEAEHEGGIDPHTWLGREAVKAQLAAMLEALVTFDPAGAAVYRKNHGTFVADIDAVFEKLAPALEPLRSTSVFVYHPSFGYFLDEFGIVQEAVETGGKEPTQKGLAALAAEAREDGARAIFVQAQFPTAAARTLAKAIGGVVLPLDALAPDWLANLERMGAALRKAAR